MIKILSISGSPVPQSSTDIILGRLAHSVLDELKGRKQAEVSFIKLSSLTFRACQSCGVAPTPKWCFYDDLADVLDMVEKHKPALIDERSSWATNWAAYEGAVKLIRIDGVRDELFSLDVDPLEQRGLRTEAEGDRTSRLAAQLETFLEKARSRRPASLQRRKVSLDDEFLQQRLRGLGYIE